MEASTISKPPTVAEEVPDENSVRGRKTVAMVKSEHTWRKRKNFTPVRRDQLSKRGRTSPRNKNSSAQSIRRFLAPVSKPSSTTTGTAPSSPVMELVEFPWAGARSSDSGEASDSKGSMDDDELSLTAHDIQKLRRELLDCQSFNESLIGERERHIQEVKDFRDTLKRAAANMREILKQMSQRMHLENKKELQQQAERLGKLMPSTRSATGHHWKGGTEEKSILDAHKRLQSFKAQLDEEKTQYRKLLRIRRARANTEGNATAAPEVSSSSSAMVQDEDTNTKILGLADMLPTDEAEYQIHEAKENIQMMEMTLKKTESDLVERENRLHAERTLFNKELRTCNSHEQSAFGNYPCLGKSTDGLLPGRYQLMTMIGKGGFSEVFKAYDLETHSYVAVKIHQIRPDMTEVAREAYVRHTWREYGIHKRLKHRRIIQLYDYFPIDCHSFGTVLEFCEGVDLDTYLKAHGPIPEKEARGIMVQVFSGLRYMNSAGHKIIHYDLKPGNLMYYEGNIKITDFGLSKQVDQHQNHDTVELTSLGTGTYWYLPPECFDTSAAKISNKVDVWSCGVIFYELLFARKPFGHGISQDHLIRAGTIKNAHGVEFPQSGRVSKEAKSFIQRLLIYDRQLRPDVIEAANDPYIRRV